MILFLKHNHLSLFKDSFHSKNMENFKARKTLLANFPKKLYLRAVVSVSLS